MASMALPFMWRCAAASTSLGGRGLLRPGKPYHHFVGHDASRAFATGCATECVSVDLKSQSVRAPRARPVDGDVHVRESKWNI